MAFIRAQNVRYDEQGRIASGSAAIMESEYVRGQQHHSRQVVRERLGKVIWLAEDKKSGIFLSPARGLVAYNAREDSFAPVDLQDTRILGSPRLPRLVCTQAASDRAQAAPAEPADTWLFRDEEIGQVKVFGDVHWLLEFLCRRHYAKTLARVFPEKALRARLVLHLLHGILRLGGNLSCADFAAYSLASWVFPEVDLAAQAQEAAFFEALGDRARRQEYFRAHVAAMHKQRKTFGTQCACEDVLSLPDTAGCPLNRRLGVPSSARLLPDPDDVPQDLVVVTDTDSGHVVWFEAVPQDSSLVPDLCNVGRHLKCGVAFLAARFGSASATLPELLAWQEDKASGSPDSPGSPDFGQTFVALLPCSQAFPCHKLATRARKIAPRHGDDSLVVYGSRYTGVVLEASLFGKALQACVYLAHDRSRETYSPLHPRAWEEYALRHMDPVSWFVEDGEDFVLVGNGDVAPRGLLERWFAAVARERVLKHTEGFDHLPARLWSRKALLGKIFLDSLCANVVQDIRQLLQQIPERLPDQASEPALDSEEVLSWQESEVDCLSSLQSLMAERTAQDIVLVDTPGDRVREYYSLLGSRVPGFVELSTLRAKLGF